MLSDAGGLRFESQTGGITGKPIPSLWRDNYPAIKCLQPPEHHAGHSIQTKKTPPSLHKYEMCTRRNKNADCYRPPKGDPTKGDPTKGDPKRGIRPTHHLTATFKVTSKSPKSPPFSGSPFSDPPFRRDGELALEALAEPPRLM